MVTTFTSIVIFALFNYVDTEETRPCAYNRLSLHIRLPPIRHFFLARCRLSATLIVSRRVCLFLLSVFGNFNAK